MALSIKDFADPVIDAVPTPMIVSFEADADVDAGDMAYLDSDGAITAAADDGGDPATPNALFGIILNAADSGETANVLYHGYAGNKWGLTDAQRYRLAGVGVVIRPYV